MNAFYIVREFERALSDYTHAPYVVAVNSCTSALFLCCQWLHVKQVTLPCRTYVSVPMAVRHAGGTVSFQAQPWYGSYQLWPYSIWDCAKRFTSKMYVPGTYQCVSFHTAKILSLGQGGAILHDNQEADGWFRRARYDGRTEELHPCNDHIHELGWHCYLSPDIAAQGLWRMMYMPRDNHDQPMDDYPDLSQLPVFNQ